MKKLNLHSHSTYSDGSPTLRTYVEKCIEDNHVCLCITDHDYCICSIEKFQKEYDECKELSREYNYPIICGSEISLPYYAEAQLFGYEACIEWFILEKKYFNDGDQYSVVGWNNPSMIRRLNHIKQIKKKYEDKMAMVLCHPSLPDPSKDNTKKDGEAKFSDIDPEFLQIMDGFEIINRSYMFEFDWWLKDYIKYPFIGQDAHNARAIAFDACNHVPDSLVINNEEDLIKWIRNPVFDLEHFYSRDWDYFKYMEKKYKWTEKESSAPILW